VTRLLRFSLIALLALAVIGNAGLLAGVLVTREPAPKPLTAERIATASKPAILLIQADYKVTTSMPETTITDATWNAIYDSLRPRIYDGEITSTTQLEHVAEQMIMNNPDAYVTAGTTASDTWDELATGSGFFVTEDGYLVTAAHVVSASKSEIRDQIVAYSKDPAFISDERNAVRKEWAAFSPTDTQVEILASFMQRWIQTHVSVDKIDSKYYVGTGASVQAGDNLTANGVRASVVSIDPTSGGHDIAILKADVSGVPTLSLAGGTPRLGEATYAIGYPRTAYLQEDVPVNQTVPIAVTSGKVLLVAQQPTGWTAFGTSAQFTHGDSGGPVVDGSGNVLGIVSYSEVDAQGKQALGGGFFVPSQYVSADLASQGINPAPTSKDFTPTYYRALAEGDIQHYKTELVLLEDIKSRSPFDAYVASDISSTQSQVLAGNDKTPPDLAPYVPAAAETSGGLIVLAVAVWIGMAIVGRRRRIAPVPIPIEPAPAQSVAAPAPIEPPTEVVESPQGVLRESQSIAASSPPPQEP
jgi:serine protease Do